MTPEQFVQKYLPDYQKRFDTSEEKLYLPYGVALDEFEYKHFQEAYKNAMKAQRKICADLVHYKDVNWEMYQEILNAPMP